MIYERWGAKVSYTSELYFVSFGCLHEFNQVTSDKISQAATQIIHAAQSFISVKQLYSKIAKHIYYGFLHLKYHL